MISIDIIQNIFESYRKWTHFLEGSREKDIKYSNSFEKLIFKLHHLNFLLWEEEDQARRTDLDDTTLVRIKRSGHQLNQQRNDAIERIDEWLLENHYGYLADTDLPIRTETPGNALDRLSILSLKIYYMGKQLERGDIGKQHIEMCRSKLDVLLIQKEDLELALSDLIRDLNDGKIRMKIYKQFKMYNDPNLNPHLYGSTRSINNDKN
jgi:hypothetical protein